MALPSLAPVSALEVRLGVAEGSLSGADLARAEAALEDVSSLVRGEAGKLWVDTLGALEGVPDVVTTVTIQAALRAYRNPDGLSNESIGGVYSYGYGQDAQNGVYLTDAEIRAVKAAARGTATGGGVYTVATPSAYGDRPRVPEGYELTGGFIVSEG